MNRVKPLQGFLIASDLDGTIVENDTIFDFFQKFGLQEEAEAINEITPGADVSAMLRKIASSQELSEKDFVDVADNARVFPGAKRFFQRMQALGARVCFLTATYEPIARRIAARVGLRNAIVFATRLRTGKTRVIGVEGKVVEAAEKERALLRACKQLRLRLRNAVGIADSQNDGFFMKRIEQTGGLCLWVRKPNYKAIENKVMEWVGGRR